jgi:prolyl-tRNA synthetase
MFKETGHVNAYFPVLIPESFIKREAEHIEGFSPELAVVTHAGGKELEEPLVVRPTSETVIGHMYAQWIQSYRDLPVLVNQWCNIMRWELRTRLFLRTSEFLWQEGHTAHETPEEAEEETVRMLDIYRRFHEEYLAMPVLAGRKSESEKFPGALRTYSIEALMQDGKALQAGTSHNLGQNFAKAFDIQFLGRDNVRQHVFTTSWGVSTRMIGGLLMTHSDDDGLVLPPRIAPVQAVVVPLWQNAEEEALVAPMVERVRAALAERFDALRIRVDTRTDLRPAERFFTHVQQGVPLRIELGPRDVKQGQAMLVRRDNRAKTPAPIERVGVIAAEVLETMQGELYQRALDFREANTHPVDDYAEFKRIIADEGGFVLAHWNGSGAVEAQIKEETKATVRCIPLDGAAEPGKCIVTGEPSERRVIFAQAY